MPPAASHEQRSLFGEILDWMLAPLLLLWPMSVALTWLVAQGIANRPYDRELGERARAVARGVGAEVSSRAALGPGALPSPIAAALAGGLRGDDTDQVFYQVLGARGEFVAGDRGLPAPDDDRLTPGELRFRDDVLQQEPVRVAYLSVAPAADAAPPRAGEPAPPAPALVQVAETLDKRSRLATEIIKGVILPQFVILPLAVLLVWLALARGLAPLGELQRRIRQRPSHDLSPIDAHDAPEEFAPMLRAINDLLARLDGSIGAQKQFLADAAHQLKTPLAGLRTQAELAQRELEAGGDHTAVKRSLQQIARSSQRAAHMVNQLLSMARAEDKAQAQRTQEVNLARLAQETVRDFVPRALDRRIDLGYEGPERGDDAREPRLVGQPLLVRELIRNLVDNALLYTPAGGTVTVRALSDATTGAAVLQVEDSGPGIAPAERELVFQPFYRSPDAAAEGSGLGLAIVREIALRHGAAMSLDDAEPPRAGRVAGPTAAVPSGPGTRFTIRFAAAPPRAAA